MRAKEIELCPVIVKECPYFSCLNGNLKEINREARTAALNGKEIEGMHNTMCGSCTILVRNTRVLDEKIEALKNANLHEQT